jgi:hypothetical protein
MGQGSPRERDELRERIELVALMLTRLTFDIEQSQPGVEAWSDAQNLYLDASVPDGVDLYLDLSIQGGRAFLTTARAPF